jgi:hypothetical protein
MPPWILLGFYHMQMTPKSSALIPFPEAFFDYIGEIALVKDFTSTMEVVMTAEEREAMEAAKNDPAAADASATASTTATPPTAAPAADNASTFGGASTVGGATTDAASTIGGSTIDEKASSTGTTTPTKAEGSGGELAHHNQQKAEAAARKGAKNKLTAEQKAKLEELETAKEVERTKRIEVLTQKLIQRIRPFVDAKHPGEPNDPETKAFEQRIKTEAEDLKLESFGVEMLHAISGVYLTRAGNFVKSKRFFGGGFIGRLKEKGGMVKEGWGLLGSA